MEYKIVGVPGWSNLFDETTAGTIVLESFKPSFTVKTQKNGLAMKNPAAGAQSQALSLLWNVLCSLPFTWQFTYASEAASADSIRVVGLLKTNQAHIRVTVGGTIQYYPNGVCEHYDAELQGLSVKHKLLLTTQDLTATEQTT